MLYSFRRIFAARRRKARIYMKLFGKIIKAVLTVLVFAVIGAFIFRIIIANAEYVLDEITPTENAMNAYEKLGEDGNPAAVRKSSSLNRNWNWQKSVLLKLTVS